MARLTVIPFGRGTSDVVYRFLQHEAKRVADARVGIADAIRILETTPEVDLKRVGRITALRDGVREYRHRLKDHQLRLLISYYPTGTDVVLLHIVLKKTRRLDQDDIEHAAHNLRRYTRQFRGKL